LLVLLLLLQVVWQQQLSHQEAELCPVVCSCSWQPLRL
jgi:hypothetical protein